MTQELQPSFQTIEQCVMGVRAIGSLTDPVVILIHGIGVSGVYYYPLARLLSKKYRVYVLDMPGYGSTPRPPHTLNINQLADLVAGFISQNNLNDVSLVGHSMGCQVVTHVASMPNSRVSRLILLGPTINTYERHPVVQWFRLVQDTLREPLVIKKIVLRDYARMGIARYLQTSRSMMSDKIELYLPLCPQPILLVRGEHDPIVPLKWLQYLQKVSKRAQVVQISNAPHIIQYKQAPELYKICRDFIVTYSKP